MYAVDHRSSAPAIEGLGEADREILERLMVELGKLRPVFHSGGGDARVVSLWEGVARIEFGGRQVEAVGIAGMEGSLRLMLLQRVPGLREVVFV
jgi:hypothetical protein